MPRKDAKTVGGPQKSAGPVPLLTCADDMAALPKEKKDAKNTKPAPPEAASPVASREASRTDDHDGYHDGYRNRVPGPSTPPQSPSESWQDRDARDHHKRPKTIKSDRGDERPRDPKPSQTTQDHHVGDERPRKPERERPNQTQASPRPRPTWPAPLPSDPRLHPPPAARSAPPKPRPAPLHLPEHVLAEHSDQAPVGGQTSSPFAQEHLKQHSPALSPYPDAGAGGSRGQSSGPQVC